MSIEAMKQALEFIDSVKVHRSQIAARDSMHDALDTAIKQAEKPVTCNGMPAYERPLSAAQRQWVGLTDAEIAEWDYEVRDVVMDIEKLLREKNT